METTIKLTGDGLNKCIAFSEESAKTQQEKGVVKICGAISLTKLFSFDSKIKSIHKGEPISGTNTHLQAVNFGVEFDDLAHDWKKIIHKICTTVPVNRNKFFNPTLLNR